MSLEPLRLDDLTWSDLIDQAREAIPAESSRNWTLHGPVDPGMTILDLYAARLEERLYWLDQIPDDLVRAVLRLLGSDPPRPASVASTVLRIESAVAATVSAGTTVGLQGVAPGHELTIDNDLSVLPNVDRRLLIGGVDRTGDLDPGSVLSAIIEPLGASSLIARPGVDLLPADGGYGEADVVLRLQGGAKVDDGDPLGLAVILDMSTRLRFGWDEAKTDVPPPATVRWTYLDDGDRFVDLDLVDDGTGGLRRSGVVRFTNPPDGWRTAGDGGAELVLRISTKVASFSSPPRLTGLWINAVSARHLRVVDLESAALNRQVGNWLPSPGLELELPEVAGQLHDEVTLTLTEHDGEVNQWHPVDDFTCCGAADRVFTVDRDRGVLRFGDGYAGRIPVPGRDNTGATVGVEVRARLGGGTKGNQGSRLAWVVIDRPDERVKFENVVAVRGGEEPETVAEARQRATGDLTRRHRAVTGEDYETIALDASLIGVAVARVHVGVGRHPAHRCHSIPGAVTVVVVPEVPIDPSTQRAVVGAPKPDPGLLAAVAARLEQTRLLATEVFVEEPTYKPVEVIVTLVDQVSDLAIVEATIADALARHLDPLVGDDGRGWPFGAPLRPSELFGIADDAVGATIAVAGVAIGVDGAEPTVDCDDMQLLDHELPHLVATTVRNGHGAITSGGLR